MASWPTARRCAFLWWSAPTWMTVGELLMVLLLVQLQPGSAVLKENDPCKFNGSPGVCRQYATCRKELENKTPIICTHSFHGAIVCCPEGLENRIVSPASERTAVRKCNEYRKLSYDEVTAIGLSLVSVVARSEVPTCDSITKLIVGGNITNPGEFPHMAAIGWRQADKSVSFNCGGSLISDRFVLTAAHCNKDVNRVWPSFVRLGDQNLFREDDRARPKDYTIAEFINHPQFVRRQGQYNDIALIKLDRSVAFSRFIRPACLYDREAIPSKKAIATGFGALGFAEDPSNELMKVSLKIYDNKLCTDAFAKHRSVPRGVLPSQLCAGNVEGGMDTCQGDSGGPLQITDQGNHCVFYVFGITSIGQGCGAQVPAIYTRVASFLSWIEPIVWEYDACRHGGSTGVCRRYSACRDQLKDRITICSYTSQEAIVCCPDSRLPETRFDDNGPRDRPIWGVQQSSDPDQYARKAVKKCKEYSKLSYNRVTLSALTLTPTVVTYEVPKCDNIVKLIVGGNVTKPGEFPHMAAIGWRRAGRESFDCGGSLISDQYVLTAAHCYVEIDGELPSFVRLGDQNLFRDDDGAKPKDVGIAEFIRHPDFQRNQGLYHDIALVRLDRAVSFNNFIRPACLYDQHYVGIDQAVATGFGLTEDHGDKSDELLKVSLNIYDNQLCNRGYSNSRQLRKGIMDSQMCVGSVEGGRDTCQGDSGGPLQMTKQENHCVFYIIGITSFGQTCGSPVPAIYTRVASYLDWIEPIVWGEE